MLSLSSFRLSTTWSLEDKIQGYRGKRRDAEWGWEKPDEPLGKLLLDARLSTRLGRSEELFTLRRHFGGICLFFGSFSFREGLWEGNPFEESETGDEAP